MLCLRKYFHAHNIMLFLWHAMMVAHSALVLVQLIEVSSAEARTYALVNVVRSVLPRLDCQRICMFSSWASTSLFGRSLATVAEVCFAKQIQRHSGIPIVKSISIAQVFCWLGLLTGRLQYHVIEESIWAFTALRIMGYCIFKRYYTFAGIAAFYSGYMILVDIPMYATRESFPVSLWEGVQELSTCKVDRDWAVWREDAIWMTGYFIGATQISLFLN